jgi:hypothetical protein
VTVQNQSITEASSGHAQAQGVVAQNGVNTAAVVNVKVGGENRGLISVIVETITNIFNWGQADATSGAAAATGGAATTYVQPAAGSGGSAATPAGTGAQTTGSHATAASGNADASGAQVNDEVKLRSSTSVRVAGDNYDPIDVLVKLAVKLVNWGVGAATTGDARSTGLPSTGTADGSSTAHRSVTSATSGGARATGLYVQNLVDLLADVTIDIRGSNYGKINLHIQFLTDIYNLGAARAVSGNATAGGAASEAAPGGGSSGAAGAPSPRVSAYAGPGPVPGTAILPAHTKEVADTSGSSSTWLTNASNTIAQSGSSLVTGDQSSVIALNQQVTGAPGSDNARHTQVNAASYTIQTEGRACATTGPATAGLNATAAPAPTCVPNRPDPGDEPDPNGAAMPAPGESSDGGNAGNHGGGNDGGNLGNHRSGGGPPDAGSSRAGSPPAVRIPGTYAQVDPWAASWPDRDGPPMPSQRLQLCQADAAGSPPSCGTSQSGPDGAPRRLLRVRPKPQGSLATVDPWAALPDDELLMPGQRLRRASADVDPWGTGAVGGPDDGLPMPSRGARPGPAPATGGAAASAGPEAPRLAGSPRVETRLSADPPPAPAADSGPPEPEDPTTDVTQPTVGGAARPRPPLAALLALVLLLLAAADAWRRRAPLRPGLTPSMSGPADPSPGDLSLPAATQADQRAHSRLRALASLSRTRLALTSSAALAAYIWHDAGRK